MRPLMSYKNDPRYGVDFYRQHDVITIKLHLVTTGVACVNAPHRKNGNSQGIRIPKPLVEQARLEGRELTLKLVDDGLLIAPENGVREGWEASIKQSLAVYGHETPDAEWLELPLNASDDLEW